MVDVSGHVQASDVAAIVVSCRPQSHGRTNSETLRTRQIGVFDVRLNFLGARFTASNKHRSSADAFYRPIIHQIK